MKRDDPEADSEQTVAEDFLPIPQDSSNADLKTSETEHKNGPAKQQNKERTNMRLSEWLTVVFTGVIALATIGYTIYAGLQWHEIHSSSTDTHTLAVAAKTQAEKTITMADAAEKMRAASERLAKATEDTATNSQTAFRDEHRAWVTLDGIVIIRMDANGTFHPVSPNQLNPGDNIGINMYYKNYGTTPAFKVSIRWEGKSVIAPVIAEEAFPLGTKSNQGILYPGAAAFQTWDIPNISSAQINAILQDQIVLYIRGRIDYQDAFKVAHWSTFCRYLLSGGGWTDCKEADEVDNNTEMPKPGQ